VLRKMSDQFHEPSFPFLRNERWAAPLEPFLNPLRSAEKFKCTSNSALKRCESFPEETMEVMISMSSFPRALPSQHQMQPGNPPAFSHHSRDGHLMMSALHDYVLLAELALFWRCSLEWISPCLIALNFAMKKLTSRHRKITAYGDGKPARLFCPACFLHVSFHDCRKLVPVQ